VHPDAIDQYIEQQLLSDDEGGDGNDEDFVVFAIHSVK